ncbi:unnamed protein product, partial [Protopolystoma xenopodis]
MLGSQNGCRRGTLSKDEWEQSTGCRGAVQAVGREPGESEREKEWEREREREVVGRPWLQIRVAEFGVLARGV